MTHQLRNDAGPNTPSQPTISKIKDSLVPAELDDFHPLRWQVVHVQHRQHKGYRILLTRKHLLIVHLIDMLVAVVEDLNGLLSNQTLMGEPLFGGAEGRTFRQPLEQHQFCLFLFLLFLVILQEVFQNLHRVTAAVVMLWVVVSTRGQPCQLLFHLPRMPSLGKRWIVKFGLSQG